ncbi:ATP-dependent RNA helicase DDX19A-like [Clytia hemisphaerica]|uniref:RNA helicase n=1 Tax=Clytia hemisphaerica TaxID=252671 RepID=A0A7M5WRF9_9CNID
MVRSLFQAKIFKMADDWATLADQQEQQILASNVNQLSVSDEKAPKEGDAAPDDKEISPEERSLMKKMIRDHLANVKGDVNVQQKDPNSPLYSVKSFEELRLNEKLLQGVYGMGFNKPSKIQETALPMLLADPPNNMIAQSQSGTGKTAAFVLAMLSRVDKTKPYPQALCLSPTFELANQTGSVLEKMGKFLIEDGLKVAYALRGNRLEKGSKCDAQIIIGTPGSLLDWIMRHRFFDPKKINIFVLDEADVMISQQGHQDQSIRIKKALNPSAQLLLFSATYEASVMNFAQNIVNDAVIIRLRREEESLDNIKQFYVKCDTAESKYEALANLYGSLTIGQTMVFCHTKKAVNWLSEKLSKDGHAVALLTGELEIEQRLAVLNRFRDGKEKVLITTNVAARGIDVEQVTIVINYDIPINHMQQPDFETYLHRIGRTGRFGKKGLAINFVDGTRSRRQVEEISKHFGKEIKLLQVDDLDELEKLNQ